MKLYHYSQEKYIEIGIRSEVGLHQYEDMLLTGKQRLEYYPMLQLHGDGIEPY